MKLRITGWAALIIVTGIQADPLTLQDGDRVVMVGNTFIEREARYGYLESAMSIRYTGQNITFRNLGWSGDTVFGDARAYFDSPNQGYQRLIERTKSLNPTIIMLSYGLNESFQGEAGLTRFVKGHEKLLNDLKDTKARFVLFTPLKIESNHNVTNIEKKNEEIERYTIAIKSLAEKYHAQVLDLNDSLASQESRTDNGLHLTPYGYRETVADLERAAGWSPLKWNVSINATDGTIQSNGTKVKVKSKYEYQVSDDHLPIPIMNKNKRKSVIGHRIIAIAGLEDGNYTLTIDDAKVVSADAKAWANGVQIEGGPDYDQAESMRQTIINKNELYFNSWRPQNITYLLGFRKHEQGNNAKELDMFAPLIVEKEALIRKLSTPTTHMYRWTRN